MAPVTASAASAASSSFLGLGTQSETAGVPISISGTLLDANQDPTAGSVTLTASAGAFAGGGLSQTVSANVYGDFSAEFLDTKAGTVNISLSGSNGATGADTVNVTPAPAAAIVLSLPANLAAGGSTNVSAVVQDVYQNPVADQSVTFQVTNVSQPSETGGFSPSGTAATASTDSQGGPATVSYTAPNQATTVQFTATSGSLPAASGSLPIISGTASLMTVSGPGTASPGQVGITISGSVTDQNDNPIGNQAVTLTATEGGNAAGSFTSGTGNEVSVTTSNTGSFTATYNAPTTAGTVTIAGVAGAARAETTISVTAGAPNKITLSPAIFTAGAPTTVKGQVTDANGNAVAGAAISITPSGGSATPAQVTTDPSGDYSFSYTPPTVAGAASISVSASTTATNTVTQKFQVTINPAAVSQVNLSAVALTAGQTYTLQGVVQDTYGNGIKGASVALLASAGTPQTPVTTGANGAFSFSYQAPQQVGKGQVTITATATYDKVSATDSQIYSVAAGLPATVTWTPVTTTVRAGEPLTVGGTVYDPFGNPVSDQTVYLTATYQASPVGSFTSSSVQSDSSGAFTATYTPPATAENVDLTAVSGAATSSLLTLDVLGATPAAMTLIVSPGSGTAGQAGNLTVGVDLTDGTPAQNPVGDWPVVLTITPPTGSPAAYYATTDATTGAYSWSLPFPTVAGTYQVMVTATGTGISQTGTFVVEPAAPAKVTISAPATVVAGSKIKLQGSVYDQYGNLLTNAPASVNLQYAVTIVTVQTTNGSYSYSGFVAPKKSGGSVTAQAQVGSDTETATIQVVPGAPYALALSSLGPLAAGATGATLQGTITDRYGNPVSGSQSVKLTATAGTFGSTGNSTDTVTATNGQFQTLYAAPTAAPQTVTVTASEGSLTPVTESVTITPATPQALTLNVPNVLRAGQDYTVGGTLEDSYQNPVQGVSVTLSLQAEGDGSFGGSISTQVTTDAQGQYSATLTASQASGSYELTATAGSLTTSTQLNVTGTMPAHMTPLEITYTKPATAGVGTLQVQTTLTDSYGNAVGDWQVDLTVKTADGKSQTIQATTGTAGIATFTLPMPTVAGSLTLTAAPENTTGFSQTDNSIDIQPGQPASLTLVSKSGSSDVAAGSNYTLDGVVYDSYGNVENGPTVQVSVSDGTTTQPISTSDGTYQATFTAPTKAGQTITLTAEVGSISATPITLTVVPASAATIALTSPPKSLAAGGMVTLQGTIEDQYQNLVSGTSSVTLQATDGTFANSQQTVAVTATNGQFSADYTAPSSAPETVTLTAQSSALAPYTANISITGAAAASFTVQLPALIRDGGTYTVSGMVYDQYQNGTSAPVTLTLQSGGGTFQNGKNSIQLTSGSDGTFSVTYLAPSGIGSEGSYTLQVQAGSLTSQTFSLDVTGGTPTAMDPLQLTYNPTPNQPTAGDGQVIVHTVLYDQDENAVGSWPVTITVTGQKGDVTTYHTTTGGFTSGAINYGISMPTAAGQTEITVSADGTAISESQTIDILPAAPATLSLSGVPASGNVVAGSYVTVSGTVYDQFGNHVLSGITVTLASSAFPGPEAVQTDASGNYTYQFSVPTKAATEFGVSASVSGATAPPALSYTVIPAAPYSFTLTGPGTAPAGSQVTVQGAVEDQYGNLEPAGTKVQISLDGQLQATVQTAADGSYQDQFTAPTKAGTVVTVTGSVGGVTAAQTPAALQITIVNNVASQIVLTLPTTVQAGSDTSVVGYVYDLYGNPVGGQSTSISTNLGTLAAGAQSGATLTLASAADGSLQFTLNAPTAVSITPSTITVTAETTVGKTTIQGSASTTLVAGDPATITLDGPASADVGSSVKVSGYVHDAYNNPVPNAAVTVGGKMAHTGTDGYYSATITAPSTVGSFTLIASVPTGGTTITAQTKIEVVAGPPAGLTITAPGSMYTSATVTVTGSVYDSGKNPVGGVTVDLNASEGGSSVGTIPATVQTDGQGDYSATFTAPGQVGTVTITATVGGLSESTAIDITTPPPGPPGPSGPAGPTGPTGPAGPSGGSSGSGSQAPSPTISVPPGGLLGTSDGGFTMDVSATAICSAVGSLTVTTSSAAPGSLPNGFEAISGVYVLSGSAFCTPQVATITYSKSQIPNLPSQRIWIYEQTGTTWTYLPTTVNSGTGTASAYVKGPGSYVVLAMSQQFSDVASSYWAYGYIGSLLGAGIVSGFPDGTFRPDQVVTRAQFIKMLALALGLTPKLGTVPYKDVDQASWYAPYVDAMYAQGALANLGTETFSPNAPMDREDVAAVLAAALKLTLQAPLHFTDMAQIAPSDLPAVEAVVAAGYMAGFTDGSFQPLGSVTRAQAAKILALLIQEEAP